jgi:DNA (cytosine-5)-methyltransferase 1
MGKSRRKKSSTLTVTDQFCGAGGSSEGAIAAGAEVQVALNHWDKAIDTYTINHGKRVRVIERADVSNTDPRRYPSTDILITSPECTTHSPAGGNRRRPAPQRDFFIPAAADDSTVRSRATMWDVPRFAEYHDYNGIIVENVVEVLRWVLFNDWLRAMHTLGYAHKIVSLNSMFCHPTPQSRDRIYIVFWKSGNRAPDLDVRPWAPCFKCSADVRARQTFKNGRWVGKYRFQYVYACPHCHSTVTPYYFAALNAIDFSIPGERIGDRPKPLRQRTRDRVQYGLDKYGNRVLVVNVKQGERDSSRAWPADTRPLGTVPSWDNYFAVTTPFLVKLRGTEQSHIERSATGLDDPTPTLVASGMSAALVSPAFIAMRRMGDQTKPLDAALPAVTTGESQHLLITPDAPFIVGCANTNSTPCRVRGIDDPLMTVHAGGNNPALITGAALLSLRDAKAMHVGDLSEPTMTQTAQQQSALVTRLPFLTQYYQGGGQVASVEDGMPTVSTRDRSGLIVPQEKLSVDDCYFRMLQPHEIGAAMAFPSSYVVVGTKRDRVKQYGNAVTPPVMSELFRRLAHSIEPTIGYDAA